MDDELTNLLKQLCEQAKYTSESLSYTRILLVGILICSFGTGLIYLAQLV